jgi:hypothetical protein
MLRFAGLGSEVPQNENHTSFAPSLALWFADVEARMAVDLKRLVDSVLKAPTTAGTSSAYTLVTKEGRLKIAPTKHQFISFVPHVTSRACASLAIDGGGAYALKSQDGRAPACMLMAGTTYTAIFSGTAWVLPIDSSRAAWNQIEVISSVTDKVESVRASQRRPEPEFLVGKDLMEKIRDAARTAISENPKAVTNEKIHKGDTMYIIQVTRPTRTNGGLGRHVDKVLKETEFSSQRGTRGRRHRAKAACSK